MEIKVTDLMSEEEMDRAILNVAKEIVGDGTNNVALVGIKTRGIPLAEWLAKKIEAVQHKPIDIGSIDISLYRDDLTEIEDQAIVNKSELPFSVNGRGIILVDDVLYTGRTIRAAMDALIRQGRPKFIKLMVMVDRGWRELPIQADYVGKQLKTKANENVKVRFMDTDEINQVVVKG
ncbi:MAG: bifunctional pyr operon transcriptional regulator/uracil phosphoribosyltransferase PyrR [Deltaproteobacteria bacterium]|jgi:pyrimidine operon attenuation protein / uracil phosphoribosyltransferase|nr:bifunctional pyr operon transcriptional regulator/uracil phosphoribosyltransferase PyrR [Deltaproteobacteria bacterium]